MSTSIQTVSTLAATAKSLAKSLPTDIVDFLEDGHFNDTNLHVVTNFFEATKALNNLPKFQAMKAEQQAERHCVRCHTPFTEESNGPSDCVIPHVFETELEFTGEVSGYERVYSYKSRCCGSSVRVEEKGAGSGWFRDLRRLEYCFEGYHMADVHDVEDEYNDVNIHRCKLDKETEECTLACIDHGNPVFAGSFRCKPLFFEKFTATNHLIN